MRNIETHQGKQPFRKLLAILLMTALAGVFFISPAAADGEVGPWMIGLDLVGNNVGQDDDGDALVVEEGGGGVGLHLGYMISPFFGVRLYTSAAVHETSDPDVEILFAGALIEAVVLFNEGSVFRPYFLAGLGGYSAQSQTGPWTYETEGPGMSIGGGAHYFLMEHLSLHSSLRLEYVNWETERVSLDTGGGTLVTETATESSGSAFKFTIGMTAWF